MKRMAEERWIGETPLVKKSKLRQELEELVEKKGLILEKRFSVVNLESGEAHHFEDYPAALEFLKGKKGRWYLTTPVLEI